MRTQIVLKNSYWGIISQLVILLIGFISRKIFLDTLGPSYLGLNGLFSNIISLLSLAELGISSAIIYYLYKPLLEKNQEEITQLMNFYKSSYRIIASIIATLGLLFLPFIEIIVKDSPFTLIYLNLIFLLFLVEAVTSYFFSYKRSIIFADQKNYIIIKYDTLFRVLTEIINIIVLIHTQNFIFYLIIRILVKLINNYVIAVIADEKYPYINNKEKLDKHKKRNIFKNIKYIMINKLSWTITSSTDNIIISSFINLNTVGLMANYNMIILAVQNLVLQILNSSQASVGDLLVKDSKANILMILNRMTFFSFFVGSFCGVSLYVLINPFITLWIGSNYLLNEYIVGILVLNFFLLLLRTPLWQMIGASGLFKQDKDIAILGTVINLLISLILVKVIGLFGVLLGTLISLIIQIALKIPLFFKCFLKIKFFNYFFTSLAFILLFIVEAGITSYISSKVLISNDFISLSINIILCIIIPNLINIMLFKKNIHFTFFLALIKGILKK